MNVFKVLFVACAVALSSAAMAKTDPVYTGVFSNQAVSGYDVVAYFTEGKPVKGDRSFATEYNGAQWRFSSADNLAKFEANPEAYAPQYGGYCAWAVSQGYTASGDPDNWRVVDGKLYLNYNDKVQKTWEADIPGFVRLADGNWPTILAE